MKQMVVWGVIGWVIAGAVGAASAEPSGGAKSADGPKPLAPVAVSAGDLPHGVNMTGTDFGSAVMYVDKLGVNYVIFSTKHVSRPTVGSMGPEDQNYLYVDEWVVAPGKPPRNLLPVRDFSAACILGDPAAKFHPDAFEVTDLDHNGIAEVTFGYQLANCRNAQAAVYKLLTLQNGTKYIFRGETKIKDVDGGPTSGDFTPEPDEADWPKGTFAHAKETWARTMQDLDVP